jgi:hypothetical protein
VVSKDGHWVDLKGTSEAFAHAVTGALYAAQARPPTTVPQQPSASPAVLPGSLPAPTILPGR